MLLFAITTPVGIIIGLFLFAEGDTDIGKLRTFLPLSPFSYLIHNSPGSANAIYSRFNVRHIRRHADLRCMCRDAGRRFRDGCDSMAESGLEANTGDRKPTGGFGSYGCCWVSVSVQA